MQMAKNVVDPKDLIDILQINTITRAIQLYERIRYGHDEGIGFDAALDEVLKQMGLERI